jgi:putative oxidoreductase
MNKFITMINTVYTHLKKWEGIPLLLVRLCVGSIFIQTGAAKLMDFGNTVSFFASLGIPHPTLNAAVASSMELAGGILLVVGLMTRLATIPLSAIMLVAIVTAQLQELEGLSDLIRLQEVDYLLFFAVLLFAGAGKFSIDRWIRGRLGR